MSYEEYDACSRLTLTVREDGRATRIAYGEWGDGGDAGEGGEDWRRGTGDAGGDVRRETEDEGVIGDWGEIVAAVAGRPPYR